MDALYQRSIDIILQNQAANGAYIASPNFPPYGYCWFRDGSYSAFAMDLAGQHDSSRRFHEWVAARVNERASVVHGAIAKGTSGRKMSDADVLHTRYQVDGSDVPAAGWGNFQLDGFGTWLWALNQHHKLNPEAALSNEILAAAALVADYLSALWAAPCYDCWEENPEQVHPYTLAAIYGGLRADSQLTGWDHHAVTDGIRKRLLSAAQPFRHFVKSQGAPEVDASLLGLSVPYGVLGAEDPLILQTVEQIEATLLRAGGVHRYAADTYYGGGAWIVLSAWLAWYYTERLGAQPRSDAYLATRIGELRDWIRLRANARLELPEQVAEHLNSPDDFPKWLKRWGPVATPLLWSHAFYIVLLSKLDALGLPTD